jgi:hypothetical protein
MVVAILFSDKTLLPLDRYLATNDQLIAEPASWSYDLSVADNAVEYCEGILSSLCSASPEKWSARSEFIRTHD